MATADPTDVVASLPAWAQTAANAAVFVLALIVGVVGMVRQSKLTSLGRQTVREDVVVDIESSADNRIFNRALSLLEVVARNTDATARATQDLHDTVQQRFQHEEEEARIEREVQLRLKKKRDEEKD